MVVAPPRMPGLATAVEATRTRPSAPGPGRGLGASVPHLGGGRRRDGVAGSVHKGDIAARVGALTGEAPGGHRHPRLPDRAEAGRGLDDEKRLHGLGGDLDGQVHPRQCVPHRSPAVRPGRAAAGSRPPDREPVIALPERDQFVLAVGGLGAGQPDVEWIRGRRDGAVRVHPQPQIDVDPAAGPARPGRLGGDRRPELPRRQCHDRGGLRGQPADHFDLVTSNGSFDHFTDAERLTAFHEIERCLRPGGLFLFACEYFDFNPADEQAFFRRCATHPDAVAMNCPAFSNISLLAICESLTELRPLQDDRSRLPDGRPLRALASPDEARYFRSHSPTLEAYWGSFFVAFEKQG